MTWVTSVPILVFLGLCFRVRLNVRATDRRQTKASLNTSAPGGGIITERVFRIFSSRRICKQIYNDSIATSQNNVEQNREKKNSFNLIRQMMVGLHLTFW